MEKCKELQPCPICGHEVMLEPNPENPDEYKVVCPICGIEQGSYMDRYCAIKRWNG